MATKKKSTGGNASIRKAVAGIEKAHKELQLNIKNLKTAMGHTYTSGGTGKGHTFTASGRTKGQGHTFTASGRTKGQGHTFTARGQ